MIAKKIKVNLKYDLLNLHHVVVQAGLVKGQNVYALQLLHQQRDIAVFKAQANGNEVIYDEENPVVYLTNTAGGHTQTWADAGKASCFFIGTKPKKHGHTLWDTQIARVNLASGTVNRNTNTDLPRLAYLNRAGKNYGDGSVAYPGKDLYRLEAAVSSDGQKLLIASIDVRHTGHFALYNLAEINAALDQAEKKAAYLNIENFHCLGAFMIPHFNSQLIASIQGYGLDEKDNVYVSSQLGPSQNFFGFYRQAKPREIVKIPWGATNPDEWEVVNLDDEPILNVAGYVSEFENVQVINANELLLTVAYHRKSGGTTLKNRIYKITGFTN